MLVENFRPGTIERLGLGPDVLLARNPRLVMMRVTGFGQDGPYASKPGFATIAEAMSGFAAINGEPDGAPLLPPIALTDEVAALAGAFAVMVALRERDRSGEGQVVDVNLLESMFQMMSALPSAAAHLGYEQPRLGSGIPYSVPRGTYQCTDGKWVAISTSTESVAHRVMTLLGLGDDPRFATSESRAGHRDELDQHRGARGSAPGSIAEVLAAFDAAEAAIAPVYSMHDLMADPHVIARGVFVEVDGVVMQGPVARVAADAGRGAVGRPPARCRHRRSARRVEVDAVATAWGIEQYGIVVLSKAGCTGDDGSKSRMGYAVVRSVPHRVTEREEIATATRPGSTPAPFRHVDNGTAPTSLRPGNRRIARPRT